MNGDGHSTSRRTVLSSVAGMTAISGCSAFSQESSITEVHLGLIKLHNSSTAPQQIEVLVQQNREVVYWSELDVQSETARTILSECSNDLPWKGKGEYFIHSRTEKSDGWMSVDLVDEAREQTDYTETSRMKVRIRYSDSTLSASIAPGQMDCS